MHLSGLSSRVDRLTAWCLSPAVAQGLDGLKLAGIQIAAEPTQAALLALVPAAGGAVTPAPKEEFLTEAPPPDKAANTKAPAIKKPRIEPTIAAAIPPAASVIEPTPEPELEPAVTPPIEPVVTETPLTGGMAPDPDFVPPFPFELPDADAIDTPIPPAGKAPQRRSPIVWVGLIVLVLVGGVAVLGPMIKTWLEDAGYLGSAATPHAGGVADTGAAPLPPVSPPAPALESPPAPTPSAPAAVAANPPAPSEPVPSANPPPAAPSDPISGGTFTARLDAAEARLDRLQATAAPAGAVTGLQQGVSALGQRLAALESKPTADPASVQAVAADLQRVTASLDDAASRIARLELQVQQQASAQRNEKATVLALAELKDRLAGSGPFDGPVGVLKSAAGDDPAAAPALATLDRFAAQGVASRAKLGEELAGLPAAINQPLPPAADASLWQRMEARAGKLVSVHRIDDGGNVENLPPGPDHNLAVANAALKAGDLAGAVQAVQGMDGHAGEVVKPWLGEARDRLAVEDAVGQLGMLATQRLQGTAMPQPAPTPKPAAPEPTTPAPAPDQGTPQ